MASLRNWSWAAPRRKAAPKNVLVIFEQGGMSYIDTWDPKPNAPVEHRRPFKPISSNVPGIQVTDLLKKNGSTHGQALGDSLHDAAGAWCRELPPNGSAIYLLR